MRCIISIIAITGLLSQGVALPQSSFDATTYSERSLPNHQADLERRFGIGLIVKSVAKLAQLGISSKKNHRSLDDVLEERTLPEVPHQALERRQILLAGKAVEYAWKGAKEVGSLIAQHEASKKHRRRSLDDALEERALPGDSQQALERRQLAFLGKAGRFVAEGAKNVAAGMFQSSGNNANKKQRRSLDDMLEERDLLLGLRDQLSDAHYRASSYLTKKSNGVGLERRSPPTDADKVARRLVKERRGVDYLLQLNARHLAQRGVNVVINDLD